MTAERLVERVPLQCTPGGCIEVYNGVHGDEAMQVSVRVDVGYINAALYITAAEARQLAANLTACADKYDNITTERKAA